MSSTEREATAELHRRAQGANPVFLDRALQTGMIGSPASLKKRIREFEDVGIKYLLLQFSSTLRGIREFASLVM